MLHMPFKIMLPCTIDPVSEGDLFGDPLVSKYGDGNWTVCAGDVVKVIPTCHFQMHRRMFGTANETASFPFKRS